MATPKIPIPKTLRLFDAFIIPFNEALKNELPWLDYAFGQTEKVLDDKREYKPVCYAGEKIKGEYTNLFPDEFFGSYQQLIKGYCFWQVGDVDIDLMSINTMGTYKSKSSIVFWFNVNKVLNDSEEFRNIDKVIFEIIQAIKKANRAASGQALPTGYTKDVKKIFDMFPSKDVHNKFYTYPFFGVRIYLDTIFKNKC